MNDEFYIGWEARAATRTRKAMRNMVVVLLLLVVLAALGLAASQRLIGQSEFEWGTTRTFSGTLELQPYPHLLVPRPGNVAALPPLSTYYLVAPWKIGLNREALAPLAGKSVTLDGTLIYRGNQTMIETKPEWIKASDNREVEAATRRPPRLPQSISLGRQRLVGEVVDSKCFLGVMNPGQLAPHRACAIRCISGGVPPVFVVRQKNAPATCFVLVSSDGKPVNEKVLDIVAEPVEITGEVERRGDWLILRADPSTYRRAK